MKVIWSFVCVRQIKVKKANCFSVRSINRFGMSCFFFRQVRADVLHSRKPPVAGSKGKHQKAEVRAYHGPEDEHFHGAALQGVSM